MHGSKEQPGMCCVFKEYIISKQHSWDVPTDQDEADTMFKVGAGRWQPAAEVLSVSQQPCACMPGHCSCSMHRHTRGISQCLPCGSP